MVFSEWIASDIQNQKVKKEQLIKDGKIVVKTSQLKIGNKYRPVLSPEGSDEFTLKYKILDNEINEIQNIKDDSASKEGGRLYKIKGDGWWSEWPIFENEWFVLLEDVTRNTPRKTLKKAPLKRRSIPKNMKMTQRNLKTLLKNLKMTPRKPMRFYK